MFNIFKKSDKNKPEEQKQEQTPVSSPIEEDQKKNLFSISIDGLKQAVSKTSESLVDNVLSVVQDKEKIDDDMLDEIEEKLIRADLGLNTTLEIVEKLRENKNNLTPSDLADFLKNEFVDILNTTDSKPVELKENQLNIFLIVGVNGAGKTTLIGKLAHRFKTQGKNVYIAAGDTFRAAAEEQLDIWSQRAGAQIIRKDGADPASVVFDAIDQAKTNNADVLLIDTAGRLQNKFNLMEELKKIKNIVDKEGDGLINETMLVLDANTGQNGLKQAEVFTEAVNLTSVGLTKLDGSAKGGIIIAVSKELNLPVKLIGVGEKLEDLKDFDPQDFVNALF